MKRAALLFFVSLGLFAAGSVQQTPPQKLGNTDTWMLGFNWTGDASTGSVPVTKALVQGGLLQGYLVTQVEISPGTPAPTQGYTITLTDGSGVDVLGGLGSSLGSTGTISIAASSSVPPLTGTLTLTITGQSVASAKGSVLIYFQRARPLNVVTIPSAVTAQAGVGGGAITSLTGDVVASGPGAAPTTLSNVNVGSGSCGSATVSCIPTTNAKGLVTSQTTTTITPAIGSVTGLGANVATWLAAASSANLAAALTDKTGSGAAVFANSPTLANPALGTIASGVLTNATGLTESGQTLADVTTLNVSITKHGYVPKAPNDITKFLDGTGGYSVPPGGSTTAKVPIFTGNFVASTFAGGGVSSVSWWQVGGSGGSAGCGNATGGNPPEVCWIGLTTTAGQNISYIFPWDTNITAVDLHFNFGQSGTAAGNFRFLAKLGCNTLGTVSTTGTWTFGATSTGSTIVAPGVAFQTIAVAFTGIAIPTCATDSLMVLNLTRDQTVGSNDADEARLFAGSIIATRTLP